MSKLTMKTTRIRPGRYRIEHDGAVYYATRNDEARPVYWNVERDGDFTADSRFETDTLAEAKLSIGLGA